VGGGGVREEPRRGEEDAAKTANHKRRYMSALHAKHCVVFDCSCCVYVAVFRVLSTFWATVKVNICPRQTAQFCGNICSMYFLVVFKKGDI